MLRSATVVTLLIFTSSLAYADVRLELSQPELGAARRAAHSAYVRRNVGIALTVAGMLFTVFGSLGVCVGDSDCRGVYGNTAWSSQLAAIVVVVAGQSLIIPGIILWGNGQVKGDNAAKKALSLTAGGLRLTF